MGESYGRWTLGDDEHLMPLITSANIACGGHAGDPMVMLRTVRLAKHYGVAVGAHPSYPDLQGFGRRDLSMHPDEVRALILYQLGALAGVAKAEGAHLVHVKPHGALYNRACADRALAEAVAQAVYLFSREVTLFGLPSSKLEEAARERGMPFCAEGFVDRAYEPNGQLRDRKHPDSLYIDAPRAAEQALSLVSGTVPAWDGSQVALSVGTLCVHGDGPAALPIAQAVREALGRHGIMVAHPGALPS